MRRYTGVILGCVAAGALLAGCAPAVSTTPDDATGATPAPTISAASPPGTASPGPATPGVEHPYPDGTRPVGVTFAFPADCAGVASEEQLGDVLARHIHLPAEGELSASPDGDPGMFLPGPAARAAVAAAERVVECRWRAEGVPSFVLDVLVVEPAGVEHEELSAALRASTEYSSGEIAEAQASTIEWSNEVQGMATVYVFSEDSWIAVTGSVLLELAESVAAIVATNLKA